MIRFLVFPALFGLAGCGMEPASETIPVVKETPSFILTEPSFTQESVKRLELEEALERAKRHLKEFDDIRNGTFE